MKTEEEVEHITTRTQKLPSSIHSERHTRQQPHSLVCTRSLQGGASNFVSVSSLLYPAL